MAVKTLFFKDVTVNGALSLQDGGVAPTGAITKTGWTVAKLAAPNLSLMAVGSERASTTFSTTDALTPAAFTAASCWRSEQPFSGSFANANWSMAFRMRAASASSAQTGRVKCRVWKSLNADGTGAVQLTSAIVVGSTTIPLSLSTPQTSTVLWQPGAAVTFNNEYLFVQCEWEIIAASANANSDAVFWVDSTGAITTPDFSLLLLPSLYNDSENVIAPSPILAINTFHAALLVDADSFAIATSVDINVIHGTFYLDSDSIVAPAASVGPVTLATALHSDADSFAAPTEVSAFVVHDDLYDDTDSVPIPAIDTRNILAAQLCDADDVFHDPPVFPGIVMLSPPLLAHDDGIYSSEIFQGAILLNPALLKDADKWFSAKIVGGRQAAAKSRLNGSVSNPAYMVGIISAGRRLQGSTQLESHSARNHP